MKGLVKTAIAACVAHGAPGAPPPNPVPALGDLGAARRAALLMEGGAMGGIRGAMTDGRRVGFRETAAAGKVRAMNGIADMPDAPLPAAERGETVRLKLINDTAWARAMRLHGHHFRKIAADGALGPLRDTSLMEAAETAEIAFVAANSGDRLLHCQMLEPSAGGMTTWLRVA